MLKANPDHVADPATLSPVEDGGAAERVLGEIRALGLEKNAWELDTRGYTVLAPDQVAPLAFTRHMRDAILTHSEEVSGIRPDLETGASHKELTRLGRSQFLPDILFADRVFEEALMTRSVLALTSYLLGESCRLDAINAVIKGPGPEYLPLHADANQPAPLPPYAQVANVTWLLSDYDVANGATVFMPGSHKWGRHPVGAESTDLSQTVAIEAPAGSVLIWHGNSWHGALPRTAPGLRISLVTFFSRHYIRPPKETYASKLTQEMLDRNPPRFSKLVDREVMNIATQHICRFSQFG